MTIHKAKGLEFDLVVLADASRTSPQRAQSVYLMEEVGAAAAMDQLEGEPIAYRLARALDAEQSQAEENRLLYVAATRARERLIVSGHLSQTRGGWTAASWMKRMLELLEMDPKALAASPSRQELIELPGGQQARAWTAPDSELRRWDQAGSFTAWPDSSELPLYRVVTIRPREETDPDQDEEPERTWRATGSGRRAPAAAVGRMVHAALQRSAMPGSAGYERFMENEAFRAGLVDQHQRAVAVTESTEMLGRLAAHALWEEIHEAGGVQREIPFTASDPAGQVQSGQIDLLWRGEQGWKIVDFKTDALRSEADLAAAVERHRKQVERYVRSAASILGEWPAGMLCFLDAVGAVRMVEL